MLPFHVEFRPGESPYREIVYAATRAVVSGELLPGAPFPSVRTLSEALKVNPNTAHKVVAELREAGLLVVQPGVGTVVADWGPATSAERRALLDDDLERLLVEARRIGLGERDVHTAVTEAWGRLFDRAGGPSVTSDEPTGTDR